MALFTSKTTEKKDKPVKAVSKRTPAKVARENVVSPTTTGLMHILKTPRITEKATDAQAKGVYVFNVAEEATKRDIISAVKKLYGVSARKVRIVNISQTTTRHARTGKYGMTQGGKKAYVYLKTGETITIA